MHFSLGLGSESHLHWKCVPSFDAVIRLAVLNKKKSAWMEFMLMSVFPVFRLCPLCRKIAAFLRHDCVIMEINSGTVIVG